MSYSQYFLHHLMDMGFLLRTILRTILNYKRDPMSILKGFLNKANINGSSHMHQGSNLCDNRIRASK